MKNVFIEMQKLKNPYSGLGQFCFNLGKQFQQLNRNGLQLFFYVPPSQKNIFGDDFTYVTQTGWNKIFVKDKIKYKVWHCIHQDSDHLPPDTKTKLILTIHDLNFLEKYSGIKKKIKLKSLQKKVDRANAIAVISGFTEGIVRAELQLKNKPVYIIPNGNSLKVFANESKPGFIKFDEFIFSIGIISPKKNFHTLFPLLTNSNKLHLVIAGNNQSKYAEQLTDTAKKLGVENRFHLTGTIDDEQKYWLYKNCKAFVMPSLTEGFGLPVVEAMSLGKPVFLSDKTSLPEVGGLEAYYWKNFEPNHLIEIFEKGIADFASDADKVEKIIKWSEKFSWEKAAKLYLELYEKLSDS